MAKVTREVTTPCQACAGIGAVMTLKALDPPTSAEVVSIVVCDQCGGNEPKKAEDVEG